MSIFFIIFFENFKDYLLGHAGITATNIISKQTFSTIIFTTPDLPEQTAIAQILSDMDFEIDNLEKELEKYRQVKTGMMQQLLTGKIRIYGSN